MDTFWRSKTHLNDGKYCKRSATGISRSPSKRVERTPLDIPNVIPINYEIAHLGCLPSPARYLAADRSWTVLLDVRITKNRSGWMSKPLPGDTSLADLIWVPGEGSSTGNVTGGRKLARHYFVACYTSERGAPFTTARFAPSSMATLPGIAAVHSDGKYHGR
jgi:hypothetical protein